MNPLLLIVTTLIIISKCVQRLEILRITAMCYSQLSVHVKMQSLCWQMRHVLGRIQSVLTSNLDREESPLQNLLLKKYLELFATSYHVFEMLDADLIEFCAKKRDQDGRQYM